jgi:hypothetical protein
MNKLLMNEAPESKTSTQQTQIRIEAHGCHRLLMSKHQRKTPPRTHTSTMMGDFYTPFPHYCTAQDHTHVLDGRRRRSYFARKYYYNEKHIHTYR